MAPRKMRGNAKEAETVDAGAGGIASKLAPTTGEDVGLVLLCYLSPNFCADFHSESNPIGYIVIGANSRWKVTE